MAGQTFATINDLPPELLYAILSHTVGDILFDYLFISPLRPKEDESSDHGSNLLFASNTYGTREGSPSSAVLNTRRASQAGGGRRDADVNGNTNGVRQWPLMEISSLGMISFGWRIILSRILGSLLNHQDNLHHLQDRHKLDHLTMHHAPCPVTGPMIPLGDYHLLLRDMQSNLRTLIHQSIDMYRKEQESFHHQTGVTTPPLGGANTPPHPSIAIPNITALTIPPPSTISTPTMHTLVSNLTSEGCPFVSTPIFIEALRYTQASIFTLQDITTTSTLTRGDVSLSLTTPRITNALDFLTPVLSSSIASPSILPKEVEEVVHSEAEVVQGKLRRALEICQWNDLLEQVFLRGERSDEMIDRLHKCFNTIEQQSESIELFYLLRSGLFKTMQLISRVGVISTPSSESEEDNDGWKVRAAVLSFCWTGRVIGWTGH